MESITDVTNVTRGLKGTRLSFWTIRRTALIATLYKDHRPELAELVAALLPDSDGLWVQPSAAFADLSAAWLERKLFAAALSSGIPLEWVHVLGAGAPANQPAEKTQRN